MKDVREAQMVGRATDGRLVHRPLSPHLQVFRMHLAMAMSIAHRITGIALAVGSIVLAWWLIAAATSPGAYAAVVWFLRSPVGYLCLFGWTVALWYHFFAGIRHLVWDTGRMYDLATVHKTGIAILVATAVMTVLTWLALLA